MNKNIFAFLLFFVFFNSFSQTQIVEIITKENDTIKKAELKNRYTLKNELIIGLQQKLVILDQNGAKKEYLPNELKSFTLIYENETIQYESIDDKVFGQLMYAGKLRLLKANTPAYWVYIFKRPDNGRTSYMEGKGLSRRITLKVISREMADCPEVIKKVDDDILKVHGEEGVIELVKDYEVNCLK